MKIAMIGSGAAGSVFASYLRKGGAEEVWLVDPHKAHMDTVARDGMIFRNPDGEFHVTGFKTAYSAEEVGVADIVILMVKATITELALKGAMCCVGPETVVATLQNGLGNEEVVKKLVPEDRVMYGCGNMGTELPEPVSENMYFGACVKNELTDRAGKYLEEKFAAGGLLPHFYEDVRPKVWRKATSNSGFNTVCAVLRLKIKEVYDDPEGVELVWSVWREASDVAAALGIPGIWEYMQEEMPRIVKGLGDYYPSMAQDTQAHRQTEVDSLTGAISMFGRKVGIPTPTCDILTREIKAIQANYERQY
mgnify:CR=1 FL=1